LRTIAEGVDCSYKGDPRNHSHPRSGTRSAPKVGLLAAQYAAEKKQGHPKSKGDGGGISNLRRAL